MILVQNLKKQYNSTIVLDIEELFIPKGECFGLVGNNGAGKTTLFRIMLDLGRASQGHVLLEEVDVAKSEAWKSKMGSFLDEHMLLGYLTPDEYFETLRKIHHMSEADVKEHLHKFDGLFNGEIIGKKKYIRDLSKGNLKKVGIAAAMLGRPEVVMLDEPFENLDPSSQVRLKKLILQEKEQSGITFLISSHDLNHVTEICDRIVLLEKGKIIKDLKEKGEMEQELNAYFGT
jgi:ABC-2 type transport system ATP-binding protein